MSAASSTSKKKLSIHKKRRAKKRCPVKGEAVATPSFKARGRRGLQGAGGKEEKPEESLVVGN